MAAKVLLVLLELAIEAAMVAMTALGIRGLDASNPDWIVDAYFVIIFGTMTGLALSSWVLRLACWSPQTHWLQTLTKTLFLGLAHVGIGASVWGLIAFLKIGGASHKGINEKILKGLMVQTVILFGGVVLWFWLLGRLATLVIAQRAFRALEERLDRVYANPGDFGGPELEGLLRQHQQAIGSMPLLSKEKGLIHERFRQNFVGIGMMPRCALCRQLFSVGDDVAGLGCQHKYHPGCFVATLMVRSECLDCNLHFREAFLRSLI